MKRYSWWFKLVLVLLVVNTMAFLEGFHLGSLGRGMVIVALAITSVLAVFAMSHLGLLKSSRLPQTKPCA
jgi:hypothetical protein